MRLRIATYNIHRCIGCDGIEAHERIAAVLRRIDADVVALQEVGFDADGRETILSDLARSMDARAIAGPTLRDRKGRYGNAILSRIPPARVERLDISVPGREPRGALALELGLKGGAVRIVATHLGLHPGERRYQMGRLLPLLNAPEAGLTILMGDLNEWLSWGRPLRWLNHRFGRLPAPATFPSRRPLLALDRIWVDPAERLISVNLHRQAAAAMASDHLPLVAELEV
jgi:endonuclease/exonuclease/phosphatase family metal-dependent hydrolase